VVERTRDLERMVANLETFNYTISHDLRAPLRAINGFAAVLSSQERPRLSPEGERLLDRIRSCSERMDRLLLRAPRLATRFPPRGLRGWVAVS
jgi:light-regulated signal transduction histidine kinase (bacteriophytochrome)